MHEVEDLNSESACSFARAARVERVLYAGGGILRERFLAAVEARVLNAHAGPLPEVRGMNACEWSLLLGCEPTVTIRWIDSGIDTGATVERIAIALEARDDLESLRGKCTVAGVRSGSARSTTSRLHFRRATARSRRASASRWRPRCESSPKRHCGSAARRRVPRDEPRALRTHDRAHAPRQLRERVRRILRNALHDLAPRRSRAELDSAPPPHAAELPLPLFAPRVERVALVGGVPHASFLNVTRALAAPVDWQAQGAPELERMNLHYMEFLEASRRQ